MIHFVQVARVDPQTTAEQGQCVTLRSVRVELTQTELYSQGRYQAGNSAL